jgi:hypothetical protein
MVCDFDRCCVGWVLRLILMPDRGGAVPASTPTRPPSRAHGQFSFATVLQARTQTQSEADP